MRSVSTAMDELIVPAKVDGTTMRNETNVCSVMPSAKNVKEIRDGIALHAMKIILINHSRHFATLFARRAGSSMVKHA